MFGAYQAGVWSGLHEYFRPDMIVGASVGALNGWVIAGGMPPDQLAAEWLDARHGEKHRLRFPHSIYDGFIDAGYLTRYIREIHETWTPKCAIGVALTELWNFRRRLVMNAEIGWEHLAASCGVPLFLPQYNINGKRYADGGLLTALPLWGAIQMGADRIVAVNLLANGTAPALTASARILRALTGFDNKRPPELKIVDINPPSPLGAPDHMVGWNAERSRRWIEAGRNDAAAKKQIVCDMFSVNGTGS